MLSGIAVTPSISLFNGLSTKLSDSSSVPGSKTYLENELLITFPSFLITSLFRTCIDVLLIISILSY